MPVSKKISGETRVKDLNIDLKQMRSFLELVKERNFTRASRNLRLNQATISNHLASLEKSLGVDLVHRSSKDFSLTPEGEVFRKYCESMLRDTDLLRETIGSAKTGGTSVVAASTIPSAYILPAAIARVKSRYPDLQYSIEVSDSREVIETVREGGAEIGIAGRMIKIPQMMYEKIYSDRLVLISPPGMLKKEIKISDIAGLPMVTRQRGSGTRDAYEQALAAQRITLSGLNITLECSTSEGVREAVAAGLGVAFVSDLAVRNDVGLKRVEKVAVRNLDIRRNFYLLRVKSRKLSFPADILRGELSARSK